MRVEANSREPSLLMEGGAASPWSYIHYTAGLKAHTTLLLTVVSGLLTTALTVSKGTFLANLLTVTSYDLVTCMQVVSLAIAYMGLTAVLVTLTLRTGATATTRPNLDSKQGGHPTPLPAVIYQTTCLTVLTLAILLPGALHVLN